MSIGKNDLFYTYSFSSLQPIFLFYPSAYFFCRQIYSTRKKKLDSDNGPTWRVPVRKLGEVSWESRASYEDHLMGRIEWGHFFGVNKISRVLIITNSTHPAK